MNRLPSLLWKCTQRSLIALSISAPIGYKYWSKCRVKSSKLTLWTDIQSKCNSIIRRAHLNGNKTIDEITNDMLKSFVYIYDYSLVGIETTSVGSGFFVTNDGYILTNSHVIKESEYLIVNVFKPDDNGDIVKDKSIKYMAKIVYIEPQIDLALIRVKHITSKSVSFSNDFADLGDQVMALGNPDIDYSVCDGIINNGHRMTNDISIGYYNMFHIQIDPNQRFITSSTTISAGYSGGPLINMNGQVVAVNWGGLDYFEEYYSTSVSNVKEFIKRGLAFEKLYEGHGIQTVYCRHSVKQTNALSIAVHDFDQDLKEDIQEMPGMANFAANLGNDINAVIVWCPLNTTIALNNQQDNGFQAYDIILEVNESRVQNIGDLKSVMKNVENNQMMVIRVWRNDDYKNLNINPTTIDQALI